MVDEKKHISKKEKIEMKIDQIKAEVKNDNGIEKGI